MVGLKFEELPPSLPVVDQTSVKRDDAFWSNFGPTKQPMRSVVGVDVVDIMPNNTLDQTWMMALRIARPVAKDLT